MATGRDGKYRMNPQLATHSDRVSEGRKSMPSKMPMADSGGEPGDEESARSITIHQRQDGSHFSKSDDGETMEHPHIGHALMAAAHHMEPTGMHHHSHHDGGITSHHVGEDGEVQGPHEHENMDALAEHMKGLEDDGDGDGTYGHERGDMDMESGLDGLG